MGPECWKLPSHRATPHQGSAARSRVMVKATGRERKRKEQNGKERVESHDIAVYKERKVEEEKEQQSFV
jgi:hypothetical protein